MSQWTVLIDDNNEEYRCHEKHSFAETGGVYRSGTYRYCKKCYDGDAKQRRKTNIEKELCDCGNARETGFRNCSVCIAKSKRNCKIRRNRLALKNECVRCGVSVVTGIQECPNCAERSSSNNRKRYSQRVSKGLCVACRLQPLRSKDSNMCVKCAIDRQGRYVKRSEVARLKNICVDCGDFPPVEGRARCAKCLKDNSDLHKEKRRVNKENGTCAKCSVEKITNESSYLCAGCYHKQQEKRIAFKKEVFYVYGGPRCVCCGEDNIRFLSMDHINGGGNQHRKSLVKANDPSRGDLFKWLKNNNYPEGFQVLCMNCNAAKGWWGSCPHEKENPFIVSCSGERISPNSGLSNLDSVAVALGKICRFSGNSKRFYSVLQHSLVVCDLVPDEYKIYALLHDCTEAAIGDVTSPYKPSQLRYLEEKMFKQTLLNLGISLPSEEAQKIVKLADEEALTGETWVVGPDALQLVFPDRSKHAEKLVRKYIKDFPIEECIRPDGQAILEFLGRVKDYQ